MCYRIESRAFSYKRWLDLSLNILAYSLYVHMHSTESWLNSFGGGGHWENYNPPPLPVPDEGRGVLIYKENSYHDFYEKVKSINVIIVMSLDVLHCSDVCLSVCLSPLVCSSVSCLLFFFTFLPGTLNLFILQSTKSIMISQWKGQDWMIDYIVFYAVSAIFRPYKQRLKGQHKLKDIIILKGRRPHLELYDFLRIFFPKMSSSVKFINSFWVFFSITPFPKNIHFI